MQSSRPKSAAPFLQIQGRTINRKAKAEYVRSKSAIGGRSIHSAGGGDTSSSINGQLGLDKVSTKIKRHFWVGVLSSIWFYTGSTHPFGLGGGGASSHFY